MAATPSSPVKSPASPASLPQIAPLAKYKLGACLTFEPTDRGGPGQGDDWGCD